MRTRALRLWSLPLLSGLVLATCTSRQPVPAHSPAHTRVEEDTSYAKAAEVLAKAAAVEEPQVTEAMVQLAQDYGVKFWGLEHRLKSVESIERKLRLKAPNAGDLQDVKLDDGLRYTLVVEEQPPGAYNRKVAAILKHLEADGGRVVEVKNYWPRGDGYSGVHSILQTKSGLRWEIQFHTPESLQVKNTDRGEYEELRDPTTSVARKKELFDAMTQPWETVPIPMHVLEPYSLHPLENITERTSP